MRVFGVHTLVCISERLEQPFKGYYSGKKRKEKRMEKVKSGKFRTPDPEEETMTPFFVL